MRILHVITSLYTGGAEHLLVDLLPLLKDNGKNQVDLLLINGVETAFKKAIQQAGIQVFSLSSTNDVYNPKNIFRMWKYLRNYDIIHTHNTACQFFVPIAQQMTASTALLVTTEHSSSNRRRSSWWLKPIDCWMYNQYRAIICIADQPRKNLEAYIGKKPSLLTINNGVNIQRFVRSVKDISAQDSFVITMVAAIRAEKDHATLLKSLTHLPDNYRLQIVGGGEKVNCENLKAHCEELGLENRVVFMGVRQDIPDILEKSDILVLSSHWEGLSLSSIEGMASGRPFIASDVDGLREIVGGAGMLFPHGDDKELARQIQFLCEHPDEYREVARRCQDRARQYDISIMANNYLDLYHSLFNPKG